jgi:peptidoglycan hydrolase CwlO-like protein
MIKRILWATALLAFVGTGPAFAQDKPSEVHGKVSKTIATESKAQENADSWSYDKQNILTEIRDLKYRVTWKQYRQKKYKIYNEGVKEEIKNLQFKKEEINKLREQIDPYLEEVVDRIEAFV